MQRTSKADDTTTEDQYVTAGSIHPTIVAVRNWYLRGNGSLEQAGVATTTSPPHADASDDCDVPALHDRAGGLDQRA
ncbi:hypothetical protein GCM10010981_27060 [Dyella nitratireducens]|uniref:Uncharacterized protein n=1 Tax=Dyella nitratireducens TaxID=1849580 RepID=A0ABQ1G3V7_9GAMM|nr:hypothetical protein GCM10010981_27060 [Dyella nitratireducens]GLQ41084.1 hypothetical protein GCM10007902_09340 [Dyella nitratireducens]